MTFYIYIIYSKSLNKYYVGSCQNVAERVEGHLNSRSKFTRSAKDWELKYTETFATRNEASKGASNQENEKQDLHRASYKYKRLERPDVNREGYRFESDILHKKAEIITISAFFIKKIKLSF